MLLVCLLASLFACASGAWIRWEEREVDCGAPDRRTNSCRPMASIPNGRSCERRSLSEWASLGHNLTAQSHIKAFKHFRPDMEVSLCPLSCEASPVERKLSVTVKTPYQNTNCTKYYSYGYVRTDDWLMWITDICHSRLRIWCPFRVVD